MRRMWWALVALAGLGTLLTACNPLVGIVQVAAGADDACAVLSDGRVQCWGANQAGQLGDGTMAPSTHPVEVVGITTATSVTVGGDHVCAVLADTTVRCWGAGSQGQLGNGTLTNFQTTPVTVSGLSGVSTISAGLVHTCATLVDGTARCWGQDGYGQLGDGGTTVYETSPVTVSGLTGLSAVTSGLLHTCASRDDGSAHCWGYNEQGSLGDGTTVDRSAPVAVVGLNEVTSIGAGAAHTCATLTDGSARCWGYNSAGQLGDLTTTNRTSPVLVPGLTDVVRWTGGTEHTCVTLADTSVRCWGANSASQLGDGTFANRLTPVPVVAKR